MDKRPQPVNVENTIVDRSFFCRSAFNYDTDAASDESALLCLDETRTQQQFADEVDINTIVRNFNLTGELPKDLRAPTFSDFEGIFDFQSAMNQVIEAQGAFMQMPAEVRTRFHNNPQAFVEFCSKPENVEEMTKLGLVAPEAVQRVADERKRAHDLEISTAAEKLLKSKEKAPTVDS
ncbi:MAG: internal scaffolding protein [Microvirus sp.]|nr:MAG: internal scaffolding protein [Microvirus sp.]